MWRVWRVLCTRDIVVSRRRVSFLPSSQLFNTRSTQLILKAGALKTAGLKMISSKHLALCSQCLAVVRAAISCIRAAVVSHLHPQHHGPVLGELDKVAKVRAHCIASRPVAVACVFVGGADSAVC